MQENHLPTIIQLYNLPPDTQIAEELNGGLSNNYALVGEGAKYFLKQYRHTDVEKVKEIHQVKKYFSEGGIPVIQPIQNIKGETFVVLDDIIYAFFPFVVGKHQHDGEVSDTALQSLTQTLARIHQLSRTNPYIIKDSFKGWQREGFQEKAQAILDIIDKKEDKTELDLQMKQSVLIKRDLVLANSKSLADFNLANDTLTHGDFHAYNVFFNGQDQVEWVFDLEKAQMAPRVYELVRSMELITLNGFFDESHLNKAKTFLKTYHQYFPLSEEELRKGLEIRFIRDYHSLWIEGEIYLKGNDRFNRFFPAGLATLLYLIDNFQEYVQRLEWGLK